MSNTNQTLILNRPDLNWAIYASEIKNNPQGDGIISLEAKEKLVLKAKKAQTSSLVSGSNNTIDKNNLDDSSITNNTDLQEEISSSIEIASDLVTVFGKANIENLEVTGNLDLQGGLKLGTTNFNEITKTIQTKHYSTNNTDLGNYYINASNLKLYNGLSFELLYDFSINISPILENSKFKLTTNLNYLTSNYNNTKLQLKLFYNIEPSGITLIDSSEVLLSDNILGNDNTSFVYELFNNINLVDLSGLYNIGDNIKFYYKVSNYNQAITGIPDYNIDYSNNVPNQNKSTILFEGKNNNLILEELEIINNLS